MPTYYVTFSRFPAVTVVHHNTSRDTTFTYVEFLHINCGGSSWLQQAKFFIQSLFAEPEINPQGFKTVPQPHAQPQGIHIFPFFYN